MRAAILWKDFEKEDDAERERMITGHWAAIAPDFKCDYLETERVGNAFACRNCPGDGLFSNLGVGVFCFVLGPVALLVKRETQKNFDLK